VLSSPALCISIRMSEPPMNSPLTNTWGGDAVCGGAGVRARSLPLGHQTLACAPRSRGRATAGVKAVCGVHTRTARRASAGTSQAPPHTARLWDGGPARELFDALPNAVVCQHVAAAVLEVCGVCVLGGGGAMGCTVSGASCAGAHGRPRVCMLLQCTTAQCLSFHWQLAAVSRQ
jgi:hypothetical protein